MCLLTEGFVAALNEKKMWRQINNKAHRFEKNQTGKHDLLIVQISRDDVVARKVVPSEPNPSDLKPGQKLIELSYQRICVIVYVNVLTFNPQKICQESKDSIVYNTILFRLTVVP